MTPKKLVLFLVSLITEKMPLNHIKWRKTSFPGPKLAPYRAIFELAIGSMTPKKLVEADM